MTLAIVIGLVGGALLGLVPGPLWPEAGATRWFDLRWRGYGPAEAAAFMAAREPAGTTLAERPLRGFDSLLIGLFALLLLIGAGRRWSGWLLPVSFTFGLADPGQYAATAANLRDGGSEGVARASLLTQATFLVVAVAVSGWVRGRRG